MKLTAVDLGQKLDEEARRMVAFAHDPEHYIRPADHESAEVMYPAHLVLRMKLPSWETSVKFVYSVDVRDGRGTRHLSVQISVPGHLSQGEVTMAAPTLLEIFDRPVRCFFPLTEGIRYQIIASAPIPVVDPRSPPSERNVHYRTVVTFHFVVDHGIVDEVAAARLPEAKKVAIRLIHAALAQLSRESVDVDVRDAIDEQARDLYERHAAVLPPPPLQLMQPMCMVCETQHAPTDHCPTVV